MMATAPPFLLDPSQVRLTMPMSLPPPSPPPATIQSKSRLLDILKILVGLFIALLLAGILVVLVFVPRTSNVNDLRESNEKIAKLQRESNENISQLQREQQIFIENDRQKHQEFLIEQQLLVEVRRLEHQENLTEKHRLEDRLLEQQRHEQASYFAIEQSRQQLAIEEKRLQLLLEERQLAEEHRKEDLSRENADLLSNFIEQLMYSEQPLNASNLQFKVDLLIRQFDPLHKSLLIGYLYKLKLLNIENSDSSTLDLRGANLKDLDLDELDLESGQVGPWLNYTQLALPLANLINASFEQMYLNEANFSLSNMTGASFRSSTIIQADFYRAILSLSNFRDANVSQSHFSYTKIRRASFQNANLTSTQMDNADLESTNFQSAIAIETNFSRSEISDADFRYADLSHARMDDTSIRSSNFYFAKAFQTNFTHAAMPNCIFRWTNLTDASFKNAFLAGADFENANVQNADFTEAFLAGATITPGQLDVALSITRARLPDGSTGKNKNLVKNGNAQCTGITGTVPDWTMNENVFTIQDQFSTECAFQSKEVNATLQQTIDIRRYKRLIENGQGQVYIEMQYATTDLSNPSVYMIVRFFNSENNEIGQEISSLDIPPSTPPPKFSATLPCPSNTAELQVTIVFREANATVDNIFVTIE